MLPIANHSRFREGERGRKQEPEEIFPCREGQTEGGGTKDLHLRKERRRITILKCVFGKCIMVLSDFTTMIEKRVRFL